MLPPQPLAVPPGPGPGEVPPLPEPNLEEQLDQLQRCLSALREQQPVRQILAEGDDKVQKQLDLQRKQIEVLEKMIRLLAEQLKRTPPAGAAVEKLQTQVATLESRGLQAARRDQEVAHEFDKIEEHIDAEERYGPRLPATLKELFLPSRTNETTLSIYGQIFGGYHEINGQPGRFESPQFSPYFLLQLNDQFLLEANIDITRAGVDVPTAQVDWVVTDWLTVVGGRYLTPIGFFNERLNHEWINKLPDEPLMFRQVSPLISTDGLQLRGAFYPCCHWPVKLEYSLYAGNGLEFAQKPTDLTTVADLGGLVDAPDEVDAKALGFRVGFWVPPWGLAGGVSGYFNGHYSPDAPDQIELWQLDLGFHRGPWDARFEFARLYQQATSFIGNNIRRTGLYAQLAYRFCDLPVRVLQNTEVVARYSRVWFNGIDPTGIDLTAFDNPVDVPVNRDQYTLGLNYYFYPSMVLKFAYEFNHEFEGFHLHDNAFLAQFAWSF
jgi:hypothetical protein